MNRVEHKHENDSY